MKIIGEDTRKTTVEYFADSSDPAQATRIFQCDKRSIRGWQYRDIKEEDLHLLPYRPIIKMNFSLDSTTWGENLNLTDKDMDIPYIMKAHQTVNLVSYLLHGWVKKVDGETMCAMFHPVKKGHVRLLELVQPDFFSPAEIVRIRKEFE